MVVPLKTAPKNKASDIGIYNPEDGPFWTMEPDGQKKTVFAETGVASKAVTPSTTLIDVFMMAVKRRPNKVAMRTEGMPPLKKGEQAPPALPLDQWKSWTWKNYLSDVRKAAKGLIKLGHTQHDAVNVFGFNSPEWLIGQMSAIFAGGKVAGIYPSDTPDQVQFKSFHSNAAVAFVEDEGCLAKYTEVVEDLPYLKCIVTWACAAPGDIKRSDGSVCKTMTYNELLKLGGEVEESVLDDRIAAIKPGHCCALIYTSGTTGKPKAVMISHDNLAFESNSVLPQCNDVGKVDAEERLISYLPLSHVAGMMVDIVCPIVMTAYQKGYMSTNFARPYDLKTGTLGQRLNAIEPTIFLGVPRVWEKIAEKLQAIGAQTKGLKKKLSTKAKAKGLAYQTNMLIGGNGKKPSLFGLFGKLLMVIKKKLGLSKCKFAFAGAAPMTGELLSYFGSLGINVNEVYGMSESSGATTWSNDICHQWKTVGYELPGVEVKCFKIDAAGKKTEVPKAKNIFSPTETEQGEICFRGRHVMMGYMANEKLGDEHMEQIKSKNEEAIDEEGWLHSGDKGAVSWQGMVRITGRYKELIIGAGGENIAPVPIEDNMKKLCPFISNIMMYGDKKKFNVCLISIKCQGATGELPGSNQTDGPAAAYGATIGECATNPAFVKAVTDALKATGNDGDVTPSNAAKIQKWTLLPIDFSVATDELTATLKLKRSVVESKYQDLIDAMYESSDVFVPYSVTGKGYDGVVGRKDSHKGSFKANEPLDMVDDVNAEDVKIMESEEAANESA